MQKKNHKINKNVHFQTAAYFLSENISLYEQKRYAIMGNKQQKTNEITNIQNYIINNKKCRKKKLKQSNNNKLWSE